MIDGKPEVGLQKLGQLTENIVINVATQAKRGGNFIYANYNPQDYIPQSKLLEKMIKESVIDVGVLGNCKTFGK
jgi:hypothetical protein